MFDCRFLWAQTQFVGPVLMLHGSMTGSLAKSCPPNINAIHLRYIYIHLHYIHNMCSTIWSLVHTCVRQGTLLYTARYRHLNSPMMDPSWFQLCNVVRRSHKKRIMLFRASARLQVRPMTCKLHDSWGSFDWTSFVSNLPKSGASHSRVSCLWFFFVLSCNSFNSTQLAAASYRAQRSQVRNGCCSHGRSTVQDKCGWRGWVSWWSTWL